MFKHFKISLERIDNTWITEYLARICHEANRAICVNAVDNTQVPWDEVEDWQRQSVLDGVRYVLNNTETTPQDIHENWMNGKLEQGWKYGEVKDAQNKTHPCLVPFDELPPHEKFKDSVFVAIIKAHLETGSTGRDVQ